MEIQGSMKISMIKKEPMKKRKLNENVRIKNNALNYNHVINHQNIIIVMTRTINPEEESINRASIIRPSLNNTKHHTHNTKHKTPNLHMNIYSTTQDTLIRYT